MNLQERANDITTAFNIPPVTVVLTPDQSAFTGRKPKNGHLLGQANYFRRTVTIFIRDDFEAMLETLHHEVAHFLAFEHGDFKHGKYFRHYARRLGAFARARVGSIAQEKARNAKLSSDKARRAKNRKEHPSHAEYVNTCHLCRKEIWR